MRFEKLAVITIRTEQKCSNESCKSQLAPGSSAAEVTVVGPSRRRIVRRFCARHSRHAYDIEMAGLQNEKALFLERSTRVRKVARRKTKKMAGKKTA